MKLDDLVVEVRNKNLQRVGQLTASELSDFQAVLRYNAVGSWKVSLPHDSAMAEALAQPGAGIIVSTNDGVLLSGPTTAVVLSQETQDPEGTYEISGVDDSILLMDRLAYPTPTTADVTAQTDATDTRTGVAETVMKAYITANIGADAPALRKVTGLSVETDGARGDSVTYSARFETLQEVMEAVATVSGLGFTVEQEGSGLVFKVYQPADRSGFVRLDLQNGRLKRSEYTYSQPLATRAIVGGSGSGELRVFLERTNTEATTAETAWGRRVEKFLDQRSTDLTAELRQAGDELLATDGKTQISVSISPSDDQTMLFGVDWNLGDKVTCVVGDTEITQIVSEVGLLIKPDGVRIGATVGEPRTLDYETKILVQQVDSALRISKLERTQ